MPNGNATLRGTVAIGFSPVKLTRNINVMPQSNFVAIGAGTDAHLFLTPVPLLAPRLG